MRYITTMLIAVMLLTSMVSVATAAEVTGTPTIDDGSAVQESSATVKYGGYSGGGYSGIIRNVVFMTEESTYLSGDPIKFVFVNNNPYPVKLNVNDIKIRNLMTGQTIGPVILVCTGIGVNCGEVMIPPYDEISWNWKANTFIPEGYYRGIWKNVRSNVFEIITVCACDPIAET